MGLFIVVIDVRGAFSMFILFGIAGLIIVSSAKKLSFKQFST